MKRILSLILAIMMIASLAVLSVSADGVEIKTVDATGGAESGSDRSDYEAFTVTKKYFALSYTTVAAKNAGVHESSGNTKDNGCIGLTIGSEDYGCLYLPYEGDAVDGKRTLGIWGKEQLLAGKWWGDSNFGKVEGTEIADLVDKEVTILVLGEVDNGTVKITAYINGNQIKLMGGQDVASATDFNGKLGWATKLSNHKATVKFAESDTALDKTVFDAQTPDTPVAPKTGEATAIVALVSVLALAGVVVASKKRA